MFTLTARLLNRGPWYVAIAGALIAIAAAAGMAFVNKPLASGGFQDSTWQSVQAVDRAERASGQLQDGGVIALIKLGADVDDPASRSEISRVAATLTADPAVAQVKGYPQVPDPRYVADDRQSTYLVASLKRGSDEVAAVNRLQSSLRADPKVSLGGAPVAIKQVNDTISADLARAEALAFPILFLLSLWIFRSVVAALMPLLVGGINIVVSLFLVRFINAEVTPLSVYALNLITGVGLGLAIDYSLFMVSRFREELARDDSVPRALSETVNHAGRTIFFSSLTVAAALASLLLFPMRFLYSMGVGGVLVALIASMTSLLVLGAVLRLLGRRINSLAPKSWQRAPAADDRGFWYRLASGVMRRPLPIAVVAAAFMILLGLPFTQIKFTSVDATDLPVTFSARAVDDYLHSHFPGQAGTDVIVVAQAGPERAPQIRDFAARLGSLSNVSRVDPPQQLNSDTWVIVVASPSGNYSAGAERLVQSIRSQAAPFPVLVGGSAAQFGDLQQSLADHLPRAVLWVTVATLLLLFLMTGSVILPIKSLLMNVLTLSAAFGFLVLVFQQGRFQGLLAYSSQGALESTQPILLFALVFGLSTDYAVFLLTRIKEAHDRGVANRQAVAFGLERTGRIVTAAALLFCVAIGAFSTSRIIFIKELGLGTAAGVVIDASIVRAFLVPSLMALLGDWNWWAPRPLQRLQRWVGFGERPATSAAA